MTVTVEMNSPEWAMTMLGHNMMLTVTGNDKRDAVNKFIERSESMYGPWWKSILSHVLLVTELGVDKEPETWIVWPYVYRDYYINRCNLSGDPNYVSDRMLERNPMKRSPAIQNFLDDMAADADISEEFKRASDHDYDCRCDICLEWWATVGPDDDESAPYGPFTEKEVVEYRKAQSEG